MVKAHLVQHTHWDREWYFTTEDARVLSDNVFTEVLDELENNPKATFCLDGQLSIVDDYVELRPEKYQQVKRVIKNKQLFVGPWFTQTDALLVDAESIIRNLMIGIHDTKKKYGEPMMIGYLPDTFGFNAQMPTLLNHVGIDTFMFWRGIDFEENTPAPYFIWKGLGETAVHAINFPLGYNTGLSDTTKKENIKKFVCENLDPIVHFLSSKENQSDVLIPVGADQKNMFIDFDQTLDIMGESSNYEVLSSTYPKFAALIKKKSNLSKFSGTLRTPVYSRVHRTIGSIRTKMKLDNFILEQKILKRVEPLLVIARTLGIDIHIGLLSRLWKKVLENQAHDSIGGCVSDNVMVDINQRVKEANELADGIENIIAKHIADSLDLEQNEILLFNPSPSRYKGSQTIQVMASSKNIHFSESAYTVLESFKYYPERKNAYKMTPTGYEYFDEPSYYSLNIKIEVDLPPLGYKVMTFDEVKSDIEEKKLSDKQSISNHKYQIIFERGDVTLMFNGQKYSRFIQLVDSANAGDTYDYSPLSNDEEHELTFNKAEVFEDSQQKMIQLSGQACLPLQLKDRVVCDPETEMVDYSIQLFLTETNDNIEGKIIFNNQVYAHRLRLKINTLAKNECSIAQIQNGFIENVRKDISEDWVEKMVEKPVNIEIFDKSVSVENDKSTVTFISDGLKEYEREKEFIYITLFSTTGQLGKPNLSWRPGRASGDTTNEGHIMMATPLAQEIGTYTGTFSISVTTGKMEELTVAKKVDSRLTKTISYQKQNLNKFIRRLDNKIWSTKVLPKYDRTYALLDIPETVIVSAIHPAFTDNQAYILRIANPTKKQVTIPKEVMKLGVQVNALEELVTESSIIQPYDFISVKIQIQVGL